MAAAKPTIPKGTRDFGPEQMMKRNYILNIMRSVFQKFGFLPIETPAMENLSVLMGKYGEEGDKLLFKMLNSGDFMSKVDDADIKGGAQALLPKLSEKGLRYDLTVPFARFVVMNQNALTFPFKRYQIQPVWRADRPQKGRYREFYQCDADVVGTDSLLCEAENIMMITEVFHQLGIVDYVIRLNHRRVLSGIAEKIGATGKEGAFCVAIDKLDKIGKDKVLEELAESGFDTAACQKLEPLLDAGKDNPVDNVAQFLAGSEQGQLGLQELNQIFTYLEAFKADTSKVQFDMTLARGLSYYTGAIFEVKSLGASLSSSLSGGGRYDNLTGVFGLEGVSGVGFSFGVDRIYDVMEELELFPQSDLLSTQVMITNFDAESEMHCLPLLADLRAAGIASELYPEQAKLKKQFNYADKKGIPYVLVAGTEELKSEKYGLKRMRDGHQENLNLPEIIELLSRR